MTVATDYYHWQSSPLDWANAPYNDEAPNLLRLLEWLLAEHGGMSLGIHNDRPIRSGTSISTHAYGAALDWRWQDPGGSDSWLSRAEATKVADWLVAHSEELGIQMILDPVNQGGRGSWKASRGTWQEYGGKYWGWFHIEIRPDAWSDARSVADKVNARVEEIEMLSDEDVERVAKRVAELCGPAAVWGHRTEVVVGEEKVERTMEGVTRGIFQRVQRIAGRG